MSKNVLIIASPLDLHARAVAWGLGQLGHQVSWFDMANVAGASTHWSYQLDEAGVTLLNNRAVASVDAVWDRRRLPKDPNPTVHEADREYVARESRYHERSILRIIEAQPGIRWTDPWSSIDASENKLAQLKVAHAVGLSVPKTLVTSDHTMLLEFAAPLDGRVVVKPYQGHLWVQDDKPRFEAIATLVDSVDQLDPRAVAICPAIYQAPVAKVADWRVVVVGDQLFATKYSVREGTEGNFDCRVTLRDETLTIAAAGKLPPAVASGLRKILEHFGLTYASADFAEDAEGNLWFLDLNPQGQFLFVEQFVPSQWVLNAMCRHLVGEGAAMGGPALLYEDYVRTDDCRAFMLEQAAGSGNAMAPKAFYSTEIGQRDVEHTITSVATEVL